MPEGTIVTWFKAVGDPIAKGEPIAEAEADKTALEIFAPVSGVLCAIVVPKASRFRAAR